MAIHHAQIKSAESMGYTLEDKGDMVRAFMASTGQQVFGVSAKDAMNQMIAFQNMLKRDPDIRAMNVEGYLYTQVRLRNVTTGLRSTQIATPVEHYRNYDELEWAAEEVEQVFSPDTEKPETDDAPLIKRSENGVPLDGAIAYKEGLMAAENPFEEGSEEADQWDSQWDQAADDAPENQEKEHTGSVVSSRYRTKYKEMGHPTHSGDWLAVLLNNFCIGKKETDLAMFETICALNSVDLSKYNRTTPGWQGRLRMTGRNLLARRVFEAKHIIVPNTESEGDTVQSIAAPSDWLSAQRFNKPAKE